MAVKRPRDERAEDQQIERSRQQIGRLVGDSHASPIDRRWGGWAGSAEMSSPIVRRWECGRAYAGTCRSGIGGAANSRRHGAAIIRAHRAERLTRALSVAMPVFAYIWRYNFEIITNASRPLSDSTHFERSQIFGRL